MCTKIKSEICYVKQAGLTGQKKLIIKNFMVQKMKKLIDSMNLKWIFFERDEGYYISKFLNKFFNQINYEISEIQDF